MFAVVAELPARAKVGLGEGDRDVFGITMKTSVSSLALCCACSTTRAYIEPADRVLLDARIYTMDPEQPQAQAIALRGDTIVHVGTNESVRAFIADDTRIERLGGDTILPGLFDSHTHLVASGAELEDISLYAAKTLAELEEVIRERVEVDPKATWIRGAGWEPAVFEGRLDKALLDEISAERPIVMLSSDAHSAWVNSAALGAAGITSETPDPAGGRIERDADGEPTGILREVAIDLVAAHMPAFPDAQVDRGLREAIAEANSFGITHVLEASTEAWMLAAYQRRLEQSALTVKVRAAVYVDPSRGPEQLDEIVALRERFGAGQLRVNAIKLFVDGVLESKTAAMLEPYVDGSQASPMFSDELLLDTMVAFDEAGFQIHAHVIGDRAARQVLDALAQLDSLRGPGDRRPVLAHLQVVHPQDLPRFGELGVFAAFSPLWAHPDPSITDLVVPAIGSERARWIYPIAAVTEAGGVVVAGSDWSVSSMDPFDAMEVAITRRDPGVDDGPALEPDQSVALQAILEAYTIDGARAAFAEQQLGSISEGKRADLVVIDRDPFAIAPTELSEVRVLRTIFDGEDVFVAP